MNRAIIHKDYNTQGGGEVVAEALAKSFEAPLYVGHENRANQPDDLDIHEIESDSKYHWMIERGGVVRAIANMLHWRDNGDSAVGEYDTLITSGNEPIWTLPRDHQTIVAYTHSTPRHMYDLHHLKDGFIERTYLQMQRVLYETNVRRPDLWVANSDVVARRINLYFNVPEEQIRVVYPPVPTSEYDPEMADTDEYYVYIGRLADHKRVDEIVEVFNERYEKLVIVGKGGEREKLEAMAEENIEFRGFVSEDEKKRLYAGAKALVYPCKNEDFGMVPIEAMAAGTPVIGVAEGFTQYQIKQGQNGRVWSRSADALHEALNRFEAEGVRWSERQIAEFVQENFSRERFHKQMHEAVEYAEEQTAIKPEFSEPEETVSQPLTTDGGSDGY